MKRFFGTRFAVLFVVVVLVAVFYATHRTAKQVLETSILSLIPPASYSQELEAARNMLTRNVAQSALYSINVSDTAQKEAIAQVFIERANQSRLFSKVSRMDTKSWMGSLLNFIRSNQLLFLLPSWISEQKERYVALGEKNPFDEWLAVQAVNNLDTFFNKPESVAFESFLGEDPLILYPRVLEAFKKTGIRSLSNDQPAVRPVLFWCSLEGSAFNGDIQKAVCQFNEELQTSLQPHAIQFTGTYLFAKESESRIRSDIVWINSLSLGFVILITAVFLRRIHNVLIIGLIVMFTSFATVALIVTTYGKIHAVAFLVFSIIFGVTVDYGYYIIMGRESEDLKSYKETFYRIRVPLLGSCLSTALGFAVMYSVNLPLLRQISILICCGLILALLFYYLIFTLLDCSLPSPKSASIRQSNFRFLDWDIRWLRGKFWLYCYFVLLILSVIGLYKIQFVENFRSLQVSLPKLMENDREVRQYFGENSIGKTYITTAKNVESAIHRVRELEKCIKTNGGTNVFNLSLLLPTQEECVSAQHALSPKFLQVFRKELLKKEYAVDMFEVFWTHAQSFSSCDIPTEYAQKIKDFSKVLNGPMELLFQTDNEFTWVTTLVRTVPNDVAESLPEGSFDAQEIQNLKKMLGEYREHVIDAGMKSFIVVSIAIVGFCGFRRGFRILLFPISAGLFAIGIQSFIGVPIGLFHVVSVLLTACVSINYGFFVTMSSVIQKPKSVRLAAYTTIISFAVLATSSINAVHVLGLTVSLGLLLAYAMAEYHATLGGNQIRQVQSNGIGLNDKKD